MATNNPFDRPSSLAPMRVDSQALNPLLTLLFAELIKQFPALLALILGKINGGDGDGDGDNGNGDVVPPRPPDKPPVVPQRVPTRLGTKIHWIARKRTPYAAGGGRYLLDDADVQAVASNADPLQAGDRVCFDDTPFDQNGIAYQPPSKPLILEHHVGGVGELQQQEENDYTPVVFVPWENEDIRPGFEGHISYQASGGGLQGPTITLRVKPWGA